MNHLLNNNLESEVRFYSRLFPDVYFKGEGSFLYNTRGEKYLDFFCGSGSLNYGHNEPGMKKKIIEYIEQNGVINSLDQLTQAKYNFMVSFKENVLNPRNLDYKLQFCGPTGTNSIEAALKLVRKITNREKIIFFNHSFHGMTYGSMSVSGMKSSQLHQDYSKHTIGIPFEDKEKDLSTLKKFLKKCKREELPAAIILETIQAEGGMNVASTKWLEALNKLIKQYKILLIIDDIQAGCGRTGNFFSFEDSNILPDIICMSKSLSGIGVPFSMNLINPQIDCWKPGEHNGTFRGNNLAFIAGTEATKYWRTKEFGKEIILKSHIIEDYISSNEAFQGCILKGKGLIRGLQFKENVDVTELQKELFKNKMLVDVCGPQNDIIKIMPPINISLNDLNMGLEKLRTSVLKIKP